MSIRNSHPQITQLVLRNLRNLRNLWTAIEVATVIVWAFVLSIMIAATTSVCAQEANSELAARKYEEAASRYRSAGDSAGEAAALAKLAELLPFSCDFQKALSVSERLLSLSRASGDLAGERQATAHLCSLHSSVGETERALDECNRALDLGSKSQDAAVEAEALNGLGDIYYSRDDVAKAIEFYSRAEEIWRRLGNQRGQARSLKYIGFAYSTLREIGKAFAAYQQSLTAWHASGDKVGEIDTLIAMGFLNANIGDTQESLNLYFRAMDLNKSSRCRDLEGPLFSGLAYAYSTLGEKDKALFYYQQAFASYHEQGDRWGEGAVKLSIGMVYGSLGKYDDALKNYNDALETYQKLGRTRSVALVLREIGLVYDRRRDYGSALDYYRRSLDKTDSEKDPGEVAYTLDYIGRILERSGDQQKALDHYERALKLNRAVQDQYGEALTLSSLARIQNQLGDLKLARSYIEDALKITERVRSKVTSQDLRASYFASVRNEFELYADVLMRLQQKFPQDRFDMAALEVSERARARSLLESLSESRIDIRQGVDEGLLKTERELSRDLNAKAERRIQLLANAGSATQLAALDKELEALTIQHQQVEARIKALSPRYAELVQPSPLTASAIQRDVLDSNTVLLEYLLGDQRSWLWVVTPEAVKTFPLPSRTEIETAALRVYTLLTERNRLIPNEESKQRLERISASDSKYEVAAADLSRMILGPAAGELGSKRLVIVADGALHYIPFAALPDPASSSAAPLIAKHECVNLPSASALARMREEIRGRPSAPKTVAVLADPVFDKIDNRVSSTNSGKPKSRTKGLENPDNQADSLARRALRSFVENTDSSFARLPFSRREAKAIIEMVPKTEGLLALDFDANRATITSSEIAKYRIVHLATHGFLNSEYPELSGIVLSLIDEQGREQDGFLNLSQIYNLKLNADLVVLSACQTALGRDIKGEGLVGLTRGFMYAGAPRVVASLWQVDDAATADLMREFYKAMLVDGIRPAAALRTAQVRMWERNQQLSPYFWAAFTLQGEWR
ncbi:MAG TPA: CHAT domain-containing protein [Pyrinomonadaceae bacterium]|nr:CHAT domain-containing protein [Pyrinomonadaceae bacterium]